MVPAEFGGPVGRLGELARASVSPGRTGWSVFRSLRACLRGIADLLGCWGVAGGLHSVVVDVRKTEAFAGWLDSLRDLRGRARVQARIERLAMGNPGDVAPVGDGVSELRIHFGPGYRVYFTRRDRRLVILLAGGDKSTQAADIRTAKKLARDLED